MRNLHTLFQAVRQNDHQRVSQLVFDNLGREFDINETDETGHTALDLAYRLGHTSCVFALRNSGATRTKYTGLKLVPPSTYKES